jgi:hypothetical protein
LEVFWRDFVQADQKEVVGRGSWLALRGLMTEKEMVVLDALLDAV